MAVPLPDLARACETTPRTRHLFFVGHLFPTPPGRARVRLPHTVLIPRGGAR